MSLNRTIHLAADHGGFAHKELVKEWLLKEELTVVDHGARSLDLLDDFPDYISQAASAVSVAPSQNLAVVFGGSGQGEAMIANRYPGVRATVYYGGDKEIISLSKSHNDANVLSIGARFVSLEETKEVIWSWLHDESVVADKYKRRNQKIESLTKKIHLS